MYRISKSNHSGHSAITGEYRKIECPFPKGILFCRLHLWDKERYFSPCGVSNKKNKASRDTLLNW